MQDYLSGRLFWLETEIQFLKSFDILVFFQSIYRPGKLKKKSESLHLKLECVSVWEPVWAFVVENHGHGFQQRVDQPPLCPPCPHPVANSAFRLSPVDSGHYQLVSFQNYFPFF